MKVRKAKAVESKASESKAVESKAVESKAAESKAINSKSLELKAIKSRTIESKAIESQPVKANATKSEKKVVYSWLSFAAKMFCIFLALYLVKTFWFSWALVHGDSMNPTIRNRDLVIVSKTGGPYQRGDIVVCHSGKGLEGELIKRVIGVPGDVIEIDPDTHQVMVNRRMLLEPYLQEEGTWELGDIHYPAKVPPNQYFVMGDNREVSLDSRFSEVGTLPEENIEGKVTLRIFPLTEIEWFD